MEEVGYDSGQELLEQSLGERIRMQEGLSV
jgi:hypothetical protein